MVEEVTVSEKKSSRETTVFSALAVRILKKKHPSLKRITIGEQDAYFRRAEKPNQPLCIRLHSWSFDYTERDPLSFLAAQEDWNYLFPNFQGSNNKPSACGSAKVIAEIDAAIEFGIKTGLANPEKVFVVGSSGGGHATLMSFLLSKQRVSKYVAWVPITDLVAWYHESIGRKQKYAQDILLCTGSQKDLKLKEAQQRSPMFLEIPLEKMKHTQVHLFAGIHDGYTGSVPITHTLHFYNKLADACAQKKIEEEEISYLLTKRTGRKVYGEIQGRAVHYYASFDHVALTIFEGGHEMLEGYTIDLLKK